MTKVKSADWLFFAQSDLEAAGKLLGEKTYHLACFHVQQAVEKLLKSVLLNRTQKVPRIHSLDELYKKIRIYVPELQKYQQVLSDLERYYIPTRYPDALPGSLPEGLPTKDDAEKALAQAKEIFALLQKEIENMAK